MEQSSPDTVASLSTSQQTSTPSGKGKGKKKKDKSAEGKVLYDSKSKVKLVVKNGLVYGLV